MPKFYQTNQEQPMTTAKNFNPKSANTNNNEKPNAKEPFHEGVNSVRFRKLQKKIRKHVSWAIRDFKMIEDGDMVMVCVSGGKDSYTLLDILLFLKRIAPINFEVVAVNLDQKQPDYPDDILPNYLNAQGIPHYILEKDTYSIVKSVVPEGKTYCSACSRLRRGSLYGFAKQIGATKIALGHHRDDILATFFLNLFHGGTLKAMPPKLLSDDKQNVLIRPLAYVEEKDIIKYARYKNFPIIPCGLCGSQENLQRAMINNMLREWDNLFEGDNIQVGQTQGLAEIGLPTTPDVQTFNPKFVQKSDKIKKNIIPTINPVL